MRWVTDTPIPVVLLRSLVTHSFGVTPMESAMTTSTDHGARTWFAPADPVGFGDHRMGFVEAPVTASLLPTPYGRTWSGR